VTQGISINIQPTPNVNALKFVLNLKLTEGRSRTFRTGDDAAGSPLAGALLAIPGVVQVFFLNDFITVTRDPSAPWEQLADKVEGAIRRHFETTK
jgi:NFU1 iron-sulfur cluster scaffold homolog, mitochondrial